MLLSVTLYMSVSVALQSVNTLEIDLYPAQFVYGRLYLLFEAYPIVFIEGSRLQLERRREWTGFPASFRRQRHQYRYRE